MSAVVRLRDVTDADLDVFFENMSDPVARRMAAFTSKDLPVREAFDARWRRMLADASIVARTIEVEGRVAGSVLSFEQSGEREVTYWIAREHWGRGVATAALAQFIRECTTRPLFGRAARDNAASIRVLEKCGFVLDREARGFADARGEEIDEVVLMLA